MIVGTKLFETIHWVGKVDLGNLWGVVIVTC